MIGINDIKKYEQEIINFRRDTHMYPEIGFNVTKKS